MKLYTYFRAAELAKEFCIEYNYDSIKGYGSRVENRYERRKRQRTTIRDGLIKRMEIIEFKNAMLKIELEDYKERYQALEYNEGITFERYES